MNVRCCSLIVATFAALQPHFVLGEETQPEKPAFTVTSKQITHGPLTHFFGYIGHVGNVPWSGDGRHILALRTPFLDHLPTGSHPADVILIDTENNYSVHVVDQCHAWNPQQGTMFYWNPHAPADQFFFNDRDPKTGKIFTVLFDHQKNARLREYRFPNHPVANSGVAQKGGYFFAINYARMARLRKVTGYAGTPDWTQGVSHPKDDGVFRVDVDSGKSQLSVSFHQLAAYLREHKGFDKVPALFINHTLPNRENDRVFFFLRGGWDGHPGPKVNQGFVMAPDGSGLKALRLHIGGHPEWDAGSIMIGHVEGKQVLYDVDQDAIVSQLGNREIFPDPEGDIALSPDGQWFVNGFKNKRAAKNYYVLFRRQDGTHWRTAGFHIGQWQSGDLRQDPSPRWNRDGTQLLVPQIAPDGRSRQMHLLTIHTTR